MGSSVTCSGLLTLLIHMSLSLLQEFTGQPGWNVLPQARRSRLLAVFYRDERHLVVPEWSKGILETFG